MEKVNKFEDVDNLMRDGKGAKLRGFTHFEANSINSSTTLEVLKTIRNSMKCGVLR
jgi:hypothetical protein